LFEQRLAMGFNAFRTETNFNSTQFNELRTGFEVYLRRRLFELVEGQVSYGFEVVDIFDVSPFASPIIQEEAGERTVSKVGFGFLRDTRNNLIHPTRGNRVSLNIDVAGGPFGGETDYVKTDLRTSKYWLLADWPLEQSFFILARGGTVVPFGDSDTVPFFDRFFLGGPESLRGFEFREVGPKDPLTLEPIGGSTYAFLSGEYVIKIADPLRLALFYDGGFVNSDEWDFSPNNWNDNVGFGIRMMLLGSPVRLDYGYPVSTDEFNDKGGQFNFSFGSRF
jgi:outer membrane protein insertion porin family